MQVFQLNPNETSFNDTISIYRTNLNVAAGEHTVKLRLITHVMNTGIMTGSNERVYTQISGYVNANTLLWSTSVMKTEIANNGFRVALTADVYALVSLSSSVQYVEFRNNQYGIRIMANGIFATKTGANGWTNVTSKLLP